MATSLEKIPAAAKRMAVSVSQVYREAHAGRLTIVKIGSRGSALDAAQVDAWIAERVEAAKQQVATPAGGAITARRQSSLPLIAPAQPSSATWLLRGALCEVEKAHQRGETDPRLALTADQLTALEEGFAKARRHFNEPPHRSSASLSFELHGVTLRFWYHDDGHLYLSNVSGDRLFSVLDAWA